MYTLMRWNGKYGDAAQFVVKDDNSGKFCLYSPARENDKTWVSQNLADADEYKNWDDFGHTQVPILENVMM